MSGGAGGEKAASSFAVHDRTMCRSPQDVAFELGQRLRTCRLRAGLTQVEVALRAGTSKSTVSRLELGRGREVPLAVWVAVCGAVDAGLFAAPLDPTGVYMDAFATMAEEGGWAPIRMTHAMACFERPAHRQRIRSNVLRPAERMVVRVVSVLTDLETERRLLLRAVDEHRATVEHGRSVEGLLLVVRSGPNVRVGGRESRRSSGRWVSAVRDQEAWMPSWPGIVWLTRRGTHLLPAA